MAYDPATPEGKVRLLLNDTSDADPFFNDEEITAFLALEGDNVKRAAAQAIDTNATNEALASKVLKTPTLTTDGAKLADAMRKHAANLRAQADTADEVDGEYFEVIDFETAVPELTSRPFWSW